MKSKLHPTAFLFLLCLGFYFLLPTLWLILGATKPFGQLESAWYKPGSIFTLFENIRLLFNTTNIPFAQWFQNSLIYTTVSCLAAVICCCLAGYAVAIFKFRGRKIFLLILIFLSLVPANTLALPIYLTFSKFNLVNTTWSVILPAFAYPLGTFLVFVFLKMNLNSEIFDAARIDRCNEFQIFYKLGIPAMAPVLYIVFLFSFVQNWNAYFLPMIMLSETRLYTLPLGLSTSYGGSTLVVATFVSMLPAVVVFVFSQRHIEASLAFQNQK